MSGIKRVIERKQEAELGREPTKAEHNQGLRKLKYGSAENEMIAKNLRAWRKAAGLSQEQAAVGSGIKMVKLQRVERAEAKLEFVEAARLAELYGRNVNDMLAEEQPPADLRHVPHIIAFVHPGIPPQRRDLAELRSLVSAIEDFNKKSLKK